VIVYLAAGGVLPAVRLCCTIVEKTAAGLAHFWAAPAVVHSSNDKARLPLAVEGALLARVAC